MENEIKISTGSHQNKPLPSHLTRKLHGYVKPIVDRPPLQCIDAEDFQESRLPQHHHSLHTFACIVSDTNRDRNDPIQTPVVFTGVQKILTAPLQNDQTIALYKDIERYSAR
jgi:hypothetical protein